MNTNDAETSLVTLASVAMAGMERKRLAMQSPSYKAPLDRERTRLGFKSRAKHTRSMDAGGAFRNTYESKMDGNTKTKHNTRNSNERLKSSNTPQAISINYNEGNSPKGNTLHTKNEHQKLYTPPESETGRNKRQLRRPGDMNSPEAQPNAVKSFDLCFQ